MAVLFIVAILVHYVVPEFGWQAISKPPHFVSPSFPLVPSDVLMVCKYTSSGQCISGQAGCYNLNPIFAWIQRCIISIHDCSCHFSSKVHVSYCGLVISSPHYTLSRTCRTHGRRYSAPRNNSACCHWSLRCTRHKSTLTSSSASWHSETPDTLRLAMDLQPHALAFISGFCSHGWLVRAYAWAIDTVPHLGYGDVVVHCAVLVQRTSRCVLELYH